MLKSGIVSVLLLALNLVGCTQSTSYQPPISNQNLEPIIGGTLVPESDQISNYIVAIHDAFTGQLCTGTLLTRNIAITAAHCIGMFKEDMYVFYGNELSALSGHLEVDKVEVSKYWESRKDEDLDTGDIALVHFQGNLPSNYRPALIMNKPIKDDMVLSVAGYGMDSRQSEDGVGKLRKTELQVLNANFSYTEFTMDQSKGSAACHGDSGGPAFVFENGRFYLMGVVARGVNDPDDTCEVIGAFTKTYIYKDWINRMVAKLSMSLTNPYLQSF